MFPVHITFRDFGTSESAEAQIRRHAAKLSRLGARITHCNVSVEVPHKHHEHGNHFRVRIQLALPGEELVIAPHADVNHGLADLHAAVDQAFDDARRALVERERRHRTEERRDSHPLTKAWVAGS